MSTPPHASQRGLNLVPNGTLGAERELLVAAELMLRGYHVFRALSPSSPCDLIAYREDRTPIRIEVRSFPTERTIQQMDRQAAAWQDTTKNDCVAMVQDGRIFFYPPPP
jgi:hypothetical protein